MFRQIRSTIRETVSNYLRPFSTTSLLLCLLLTGCTTGYQGIVAERLNDGTIGSAIAGVNIRFISEDGTSVFETVSSATGRYEVALGRGRYRVTAMHPGYQDYSSAPGYFVVTGEDGFQTGNIFLRQPTVTTMLLVRHADRDGGNDALKVPEGVDRAIRLTEVASRAGVSGIYSTDFNRTRNTIQPLADALHLPVTIYSDTTSLVNALNNDHPGDVVMVVGHSNTLKGVIEAFLGGNFYPNSPFIEDFDNLFVISRPVNGTGGSAINLQYGAETFPDLGGLSRQGITTVLLVRTAEARGGTLTIDGQARAQKLTHVARKAGIDTILVPSGNVPAAATAGPLAGALGMSTTTYDPGDAAAVVATITNDYSGKTIVLIADHVTLRPLLTALGSKPFPTTYPDEHDQLVVLFVSSIGDSRQVSLQYGGASP